MFGQVVVSSFLRRKFPAVGELEWSGECGEWSVECGESRTKTRADDVYKKVVLLHSGSWVLSGSFDLGNLFFERNHISPM